MAKQKGHQLETLSFEAVAKILNGAVAVQFDKEVRKAILDCEDSPDLTSGRKVALVMEFKPRMAPGGMSKRPEYSGCNVTFKVEGKIPGKSIDVAMARDKDTGNLLFNPDAPEDPAQRTIQQDEAAYDQQS